MDFFNFHINEIEIGHRDRLQEVCSLYVKSNNDLMDFEKGFREIMNIMDNW